MNLYLPPAGDPSLWENPSRMKILSQAPFPGQSPNLSLHPQFSMTGCFLGLRWGRVGASEGKMLLVSGSSGAYHPDNAISLKNPTLRGPESLVL